MSTVKISDLTDGARVATVDTESVAPVIGHWLAADGAMSSRPSPILAALTRALRNSDWVAVHALADHLSIDVEVVA